VNLPGYVDFVGQFFNFKTWTLKISRVTWWVCEKNRPKYFPTLCLSKLIRNNIELARFRTYRTYWFSGWPDWAFFGHFWKITCISGPNVWYTFAMEILKSTWNPASQAASYELSKLWILNWLSP
jgi:hypothetical protein